VAIESLKKVQGGSSRPHILIGHRNKAACVYELSTDLANKESRIIKSFGGHLKGVTSAIYAPSGDKVITASGEFVFVHGSTPAELQKFEGHSRNITSLAINKENNKIVSGSQDHSFILWNTKGKEFARYTSAQNGHKGWVNQVEFIPGSDEHLATCSDDGTVKIWDLQTESLLKTFIDGKYVDIQALVESKTKFNDNNTDLAVKAMCFSNDGSLMVYGGRNAKVFIVNLTHNECLQSIAVSGRVTALASGENQPLIAIAIPNKIMFWNIIENNFVGEFVFSEKGECYCTSMIFCGDELLAGLCTGTLLRLEISRN